MKKSHFASRATKILVLILVDILLLTAIAGCGENKLDGLSSDPTEQAANQQSTEEGTSAENPSTGDEALKFDSTVIIDNEVCKVTITGIELNYSEDKSLLFTEIENKTTDMEISFNADDAAINGVTISANFTPHVPAGETTESTITLNDTTNNSGFSQENGVGSYTDIELVINVLQGNQSLAKETVHIYPYGEDKAVPFIRNSHSADTILIDNEYVTITAIGYGESSRNTYAVNLFIVNHCDKKLMLKFQGASVNGKDVSAFWGGGVLPNGCRFSQVDWSHRSLEDQNISTIDEIKLVITVSDYEDERVDAYVYEEVSFSPNCDGLYN